MAFRKAIKSELLSCSAPPFNTTYSKIKNYETCPKRSWHLDIAKDVEQEMTPELLKGNELHGAMASRVRSDIGLPMHLRYMETWAKKLSMVTNPLQIIQVELRLGLGRNLEPTMMMEKGAYIRGVIDYLKLVPSRTQGAFIAHIVDYKTGSIKEDFLQLALNALMVFAHYKDVIKIRADFLWTEYNDTSYEEFERADMQGIWEDLLPRVKAVEQAVANKNFPAKPGGLCKEYCPIRACEYNGKRVK
jgi:hypothetical protein